MRTSVREQRSPAGGQPCCQEEMGALGLLTKECEGEKSKFEIQIVNIPQGDKLDLERQNLQILDIHHDFIKSGP